LDKEAKRVELRYEVEIARARRVRRKEMEEVERRRRGELGELCRMLAREKDERVACGTGSVTRKS
jgi:hypothetical protein